jgi:UDP-N-acetylglucosamine 2-epimerase (non-hydrolysing)
MGPMPPPPKMKILIVLGKRAEAIKLAPVILDVQSRPGAEVRVCLTGQHREMVASAAERRGLE